MKRALLGLALLAMPVSAVELAPDADMTCDLEARVCIVKIDVIRELIHIRAPRPCWNRDA